MKPTEETWRFTIDAPGIPGASVWDEGTSMVVGYRGPPLDSERAALIATAPKLYRELAKLEWSGEDNHSCPTCGAWLPDQHREGCSLNATLRETRGE